MPGFVCKYCKKVSGTTKDATTKSVKPALSRNGCNKSPDGKHKWEKNRICNV